MTSLGARSFSTDGFVFERIGPPGGTARSLLVNSRNSKICYLGTSDGQIFKSLDAGVSWRLLYPGIKRRQLVIDTIVQDPVNEDHVFAGGWDLRSSGGGLYESTDAGQSWNQVRLPKADLAVRGFAISAKHPAYMIAGTGSGIFVTVDGGKSWQQKGSGKEAFLQTESVAIDPEDPRFLFVGTWHLGFRSTDFGKTWLQNDKGMIFDSDVFSISIDQRTPSTIFASACTGLYRSTDHGLSWTRLRVFPQSFLVRAQIVYIDPADSTRIYGGTTEGLFVSQDSGKSWKRITSSALTIHAIQVDPGDHDVILIGTELQGVLRSTDGGHTWVESNSGFTNHSIARIVPDPQNPGRFLVGESMQGTVGGLHVYDSPLNSWLKLDPKEMPGEGMLAMLALPGNRGQIAGTTRGAYLRLPGSSGWTSLPGPISKVTVYDLALDKDGSWVFAGTNDGIYRARSADLMFERPSQSNIIPRALSLLPSRTVPGHIFAGTHMGILHSEDAGATWSFSSAGIPDYTIVECLVSSPADENRILAGTSAGLFESKDGGRTWRGMVDGRLGRDIPSVTYLDDRGMTILAADNTTGGVFVSRDGGTNWERLADPEFSAPIRSLIQDPVHPSTIYLGTGTEGVYRLTLPAR